MFTVLKSVHPWSKLHKAFDAECTPLPNYPRFDTHYNVEQWQIKGLVDLYQRVVQLNNNPNAMVVRGVLRDNDSVIFVPARCARANDPFMEAPQQWLCIDLDDLDLPEELSDFNDHPCKVVRHAVGHLPGEFHGIDCVYQYSGSMGIVPGKIKLHLWYYLDRPIDLDEVRVWLSNAPVDLKLYSSAVQPHLTAAPNFEDGFEDPVRQRVGWFSAGSDVATVTVPALGVSKAPSARHASAARYAGETGAPVQYDESGLVVDGREGLLFQCVFEAARALVTEMSPNSPSEDHIAQEAWERFRSLAWLDDGKWTYEDALKKACYFKRLIDDGTFKPGRQLETTLLPGIEPEYQPEYVSRDEGQERLGNTLGDFFRQVRDGSRLRKVIRATMGLGKTRETARQLAELIMLRPDLMVAYYAISHERAAEFAALCEAAGLKGQVVHIKGRSQEDTAGEPLCPRYESMVKPLEQAGVPVRSHACYRDGIKCPLYDACGYNKQWQKALDVSIVCFPHAYLRLPPFDRLGDFDIVIIDESPLNALFSHHTLSLDTATRLLKQHDGAMVATALQSAFTDTLDPVEAITRVGVSVDELWELSSRVGWTSTPVTPSDERLPENLNGSQGNDGRALSAMCRLLAEEAELSGQPERPSRIQFHREQSRIIINEFTPLPISENAAVLMLDATAEPLVAERLVPDATMERIDVTQNVKVTQIYDQIGSNRSWDVDRGAKLGKLLTVLNSRGGTGERILVVSHKPLTDRLRNIDLPPSIHIQHFGNLRGSNAYEDCETAIITGRFELPPYAVEGKARALWWDDAEPLHEEPGAARDNPDHERLPLVPRGYVIRAGEEPHGVSVRAFSDRRTRALHAQIREAETEQAVARLRAIWSDQPQEVILLGNLPTGLPVDQLVEWSNFMPDGRLDRFFEEEGFFVTSPALLSTIRPDLFPSEKHASNARHRARQREIAPYQSDQQRSARAYATIGVRRLDGRRLPPIGAVFSENAKRHANDNLSQALKRFEPDKFVIDELKLKS